MTKKYIIAAIGDRQTYYFAGKKNILWTISDRVDQAHVFDDKDFAEKLSQLIQVPTNNGAVIVSNVVVTEFETVQVDHIKIKSDDKQIDIDDEAKTVEKIDQ